MASEKEHVRHCLLYEFDKSSTAAAACRNVRQVYGDDAIDESTCRRWFRKFREGDRSCQDQARCGRPSLVGEDDIDQAIKNSPNPTAQELAETFKVHRTTVERRLEALGFRRKLDRWVPHNLTANQRDARVATCVSLLSRWENEPFLRRIVTGDEKWVMYRNVKRRRTVCRPSDPPASTSKAELHPKKVLLSVWWDVEGIIHWEVLPPNQTINAAFYCLQLDRVRASLMAKRPGLVNRRGVILHHDNARPHAAVSTRQKLMSFGWEVLSHPPYSPDLAPTDYHLFRALNNSFSQKTFDDVDAVKTAIQDFFNSKPRDFYLRGINLLPERWQEVIDNNGDYAQS
jgi:[histone H3]-lysine36 N-dimethyltransferase SETMAR